MPAVSIPLETEAALAGRKVLVTGAGGFLGAHITSQLADIGADVTAFVRPGQTGRHPLVPWKNVKTIEGDIRNRDSAARALDGGIEVVFHVLSMVTFRRSEFQPAYDINVDATENLLALSLKAGIKKFVYTSAGATIGAPNRDRRMMDESEQFRPEPSDVYAFTKWTAERRVMEYAGNGLYTVCVNPTTVYGRGDMKLNSGSVVKMISRNETRMAPPGGTSVVGAEDVAVGHLLAFGKGKPGERYILTAENLTYRDLFNRIAAVAGTKPVEHVIPPFFGKMVDFAASILERIPALAEKGGMLMSRPVLANVFKFRYLSPAKAEKELGWKPSAPFDTFVSEALAFYRDKKLF